MLDFWSSARIRRSLALTDKVIEGYSHVCVNRQQAGKSADPLANKIQKMLNEFTSLKVADLSEILGKDGTASLLYIEDCLLTGTEITKLFASLLGRVPPGRTPKVPPLRDQALLTQKRIVMKFLVTTNLGREILTRFLAENGLANVEIDVGQGDVTTLTPAGIQALRDGTSVITSKPAIHNHLKTGQRGLTQD